MRNKKIVLLSAAVFLAASLGCDKKDAEQQISSAQKTLNDALDKSTQKFNELSSLSTEDATTELKKLRQLEYSVSEFPLTSSREELEKFLKIKGEEFWDCFSVEMVPEFKVGEGAHLRIICKRRPQTMLQYVPQQLLGR